MSTHPAPTETAPPPPPALPRGPHRLTRDEVAESQRTRLTRAMAEATAELGYVETSVAEVLSRAGVSRGTFYALFSSKQDCFLAAYSEAAHLVLGLLRHTAEAPGAPEQRFAAVIDVYLRALVAEPAYARLFMVEVYAAGPEVLVRRDQIQHDFEELMITHAGAEGEPARFACRALVAAIIALVTSRLAARDSDGLLALRDPLIQLVTAGLAASGVRS